MVINQGTREVVIHEEVNPATRRYCAKVHEQDHLNRNDSCKYPSSSGCRLDGIWDHWFVNTINHDECDAYGAEALCLAYALDKYKCKLEERPAFGGNRKCLVIWLELMNVCANEYCKNLNWTLDHCKKWHWEKDWSRKRRN